MKQTAFVIALILALVIIVAVFSLPLSRDEAGRDTTQNQGEDTTPNDEQNGTTGGEEETYRSNEAKLQFAYPDGYYLRERDAGTTERPQQAIVLVEDTQFNRDLLDGKITEPTEGPISITVDVYQNPQGLSPSAWAMQDTNWNIGSKQTSPVTVGGESGVSYTWDGLYQGKSAIVTRGNMAYVFSVTWMTPEDEILSDYAAILESTEFLE